VPADLSRSQRWGGNVAKYDAGGRQGLTPWQKPLYTYQLGFTNVTSTKRDQIVSLVNSVKGTVYPFWFADPYDAVGSAMVVRSGITTGSVRVFDTNSFSIRPASLQVSTLFSALSGYVTNGTEFNYNMESGYVVLVTKSSTDVWGVRSLSTLFKKCFFDEDYTDQSRLWSIWNTGLVFEERL
jgi:hypothetical protein